MYIKCAENYEAYNEAIEIGRRLLEFAEELAKNNVDPEIIKNNIDYSFDRLSINSIESNEKKIKKHLKIPLKCKFCISAQNEYKTILEKNWVIQGNEIKRKSGSEDLDKIFHLNKTKISDFVKDYEELSRFSKILNEKKYKSTEIATYNSIFNELRIKVEKEKSYSSLRQFADELIPILKKYKEDIEESFALKINQ